MGCCGGCGGQAAEKESINSYLGKDHERLDKILQNFMAQKEASRPARSLFKQFASELKRHINWEEQLLFPIFENHTGSANSGPTVVMRNEHVEIKALLDTIDENISSKADTSNATHQLVRILADHNFKEERILYPSMDDLFSEEETDNAIKKMISDSE